MKRLALIALFCLLNSVSVTAGVFSDTKALAEQGVADARHTFGVFETLRQRFEYMALQHLAIIFPYTAGKFASNHESGKQQEQSEPADISHK